MSTRATVHFQAAGETQAIIYKHTDGYPEGLGKDLKTFFKDVESQTSDTRFNDPTYLAAKFVVWLAKQYTGNPEKPLEFLSVGVVIEDPGDIEYRYLLNCSGDSPPSIVIEKI
uniref:Uncharacterized protein n=1 Tax=viral metagenome TaxID=1070528 RepID=A0A6H2A5E3_9ZZZZ